ncbi:MAG: ABC transporter ATP-binding protein [Betaproteobacteria bacterium]|nr:ABC transporter ATP-binding protein [Betaproteobacteria bacterium]
MSGPALLSVQQLSVQFRTRRGTVDAVRDVSFSLRKGQTLGIVGESGSGKSVTSYAIMRILDRAGVIASGSAVFGGIRLDQAPEDVMNELRGREISMIFQNPRAALNPIRTAGQQISDVLIEHAQATRTSARQKAIEALRHVQIRNPEERYHAYPFELSGGMCQRIVIAMALACKPQILIADEPTTGLDVTTQRTVMDLIRNLTRDSGMASILITHDLGLAGEYCDTLIVMERGLVVETGQAQDIFLRPQHPYTRKLVKATPHHAQSLRELLPDDGASRPVVAPNASSAEKKAVPLLDVVDLVKAFPRARGLSDWLHRRQPAPFLAVDRIGFQVFPGESVGLVGESGCGKSTTSAMIARLLEPTDGSIWFKGKDISLIRSDQFTQSPMRAQIQMVFQDPTESLNPRATAEQSIADPLIHLLNLSSRNQVRAEVRKLAEQVGLEPELLSRLPHQLSGGQKARVGIARALASRPELLILDEPTAALDVSVQAVVLNLLADLKARLGMSYLFVSHDLEVVRLLCDRVIVMQSGRIVESGPTHQVFHTPQHDYTKTLLAAAPRFLQDTRQ